MLNNLFYYCYIINKIESINVALQLINSTLFKSYTSKDVQAVKDYIYSLEDILPCEILAELEELINNILIYSKSK